MQASLFLNLSNVKEQSKCYEESMEYMEKAVKICKSNDFYELLHLCYESASLLYKGKNELAFALKFCNLAEETAERLPNKAKKMCQSLRLKADIVSKMGDLPGAKAILRRAYKMKTPDINDQTDIEKNLKILVSLCKTLDKLIYTTDISEKKNMFERLGDGWCLFQNYKQGIEYYLKALECLEGNDDVNPSELVPIYVSLYQTYKDDKQYDKALEYLWKEFELHNENPTEAFNTLCNIGDILEIQKKSFWEIQDVYKKALTLAKALGKKHMKIAYSRLHKLQIASNMTTMAENLKEEAKTADIEFSENDEDSDSEENSVNSEEINAEAIGADVNLDELSDSEVEDSDVEEVVVRETRTRKKTSTLTIKKNKKGETQLHEACIAKNFELVKRLVEQGHTINVRDYAGWLPLHEACNNGSIEIVVYLLDRGAQTAINDKGGTNCDGITPLYDACCNGHLEVVKLLLDRGANVTLRTDFGETALDALQRWRLSSKNLSSEEIVSYRTIKDILEERMKRVGINPNMSHQYKSPQKGIHKLIDSEISDESDNKEEDNLDRTLVPTNRESSPEYLNSYILKEKNALQRKSAASEYQEAMESLKRPNRLITPTKKSPEVKKKKGLLNDDDVDDSNWLENDMEPARKKRKYFSMTSISPGKVTRVPADCLRSNLFSDDEDDSTSRDAFDLIMQASNKSQPKRKSRGLSISSTGSTSCSSASARKQASLLDSGFTRCESPVLEVVNNIEPDSTSSISIENAKKSSPVPAVPITISFKVKIDDEMLLVPVEKNKINETTIKWLAEEASKRFYKYVI